MKCYECHLLDRYLTNTKMRMMKIEATIYWNVDVVGLVGRLSLFLRMCVESTCSTEDVSEIDA